MLRLTLILAIASASACAETPPLLAGIASADITPSFNGPMYGYANRKCGDSNSVHDRLHAKALVLAVGDKKLAIVTLDLGSIVSRDLNKQVANKLGIGVLLLAASHTHSAPSFLPVSGALPDEPSRYQKELEPVLFSLVERASKDLFPARLAIGRGSLQLGYNRLLLRDNGRSRALFDNMERVPYGPLDPEFVLLEVQDTGGRPKALLVHYAVHAVVLGPTSCQYSADYPGVMQERVEAAFNGVQCMFVQGGAGDINPLFEGRAGKQDEDMATMQKMGELLAAEVIKTEPAVKPASASHNDIGFISTQMSFPERWDKDKTVETGITTVLINREIAIAATPGEPMHTLQKIWKEQADVPYPLFYGYTYSAGGVWPGYIPDLRSAAYGGYGADASTRIAIGAGERIMQQHLINLYELRGMWHDKPGLP
jgi:neutral ceramidase